MYENNPDYQEYPEVTPDAGTIAEANDHKKAVATAVGGSVVLGAAAYGLSLLDDSNAGAEPVSDESSSVAAAAAADARAKASLPVVAVSMPAEVDKLNWPLDRLDELTFDEAFAAARHQMGPAHHFTWHEGKPEGGLFNTFYQQEEASLTAKERAAFIATLPTSAGGGDESASANEPASPTRAVHPSGGGHHVAPEPQLADVHPVETEAPSVVAAAAAPVITVVPLAAVAEASHDVTPLAATPDENTLVADHHTDDMHHGSITGGSVESMEFEHDTTHDDYDSMDHHHLGH